MIIKSSPASPTVLLSDLDPQGRGEKNARDEQQDVCPLMKADKCNVPQCNSWIFRRYIRSQIQIVARILRCGNARWRAHKISYTW
jgi:hypothetical protein